ncbi:MAG: orotidine-5'-phosphate decarboxylase [Ectothiorhodospiraceae bacterium AqS1]|nr:orotidine-5'-phosphate decarboxylase [Ectothiorhodospiraceae bacterium AqS1]
MALDCPDADAALRLLDRLAGLEFTAKIGLELFAAGAGAAVGQAAAARGLPVFADWKLHDIPATVGRAAARAVAEHPVAWLSVHCYPAALRAAAAAAGETGVVAITTLTSVAAEELKEMGVAAPLAEHVRAQARAARACGCAGVVCSPLEAAAAREQLGADAVVITPGIGSGRQSQDDHARSAGVGDALRAGASHVVVGRAVRDAADPRAALERLLEEAAAAS